MVFWQDEEKLGKPGKFRQLCPEFHGGIQKQLFPPLSITAYRMKSQDTSGELVQSATPGVLHMRLVTIRISRAYHDIIVTIPIL
jgi:hypothetical protein